MLPRLVFQSLVVRGTWEDVLGRLHDNLRKDYLKAMRRFGYDYKTSHEDEDFEMFFDQMYVPLMQAHHSSLAMIASRREAYRVFQRGVLFLVYRDGQCVSGELSQIDDRHKLIHARFIGVRDGDEQLVREGAQKAARHAVIHWANRHGYHEVNFQGCEPFLSKGILQDKKRWGAGIQSSNHKRILLKIQRSTPAVCRFLENNPCITISKQEDLRGLFFVEDSPSIPALTREKCEKTCAMPGLDGYFVRTVNDFLLPQPNDKDSEKSVSLSRNPM
jgi:hypothetical protein